MKIIETEIPDVLVIEPRIFEDERGFFYESYNERVFQEKANITERFVQDNHSRSAENILRGLHYQIKQPQGKLVRVVVGEVFDVAVDLRASSKWFGQWVGVNLCAKKKQQLWIPPGFAHGFLVVSEYAEVLYKTTDYYAPTYERTILWSDPDLAIAWPVETQPFLSVKDQAGKLLKESEVFP
ncbi:dTDP-4-dehydrorhamnose 3,5-epimerase [Aetokthonos hydrillicola Thurmond2011]|jgi:dTDP-4-dehydrorhamnose 3,5-epimerase|uniref:dTDP-4-dehydrorhamnose 3,5-epimerase n=1 Tax=Aetokthonos hydrillicola Thurmond2011 TaxID=2712845 RepID=A0AAP5IDI6_9CYAN|nr:dTDP-4-dehydrorhamnose 3,5-epimerase [Aetokthonos hydrillicola]MBO3460303.1 dTDP-4-dehydrorhamnose 3,5-epimerase [Aetokthonos hydrillicola CCALA 1050]MBW4587601.1 dTDP-4-dehydrorhamnose 3,5-epimerase [Aetokthonos hydrillicola CCALA 1050]MDR9898017.1 dTDP-4-dehydrorhamnose 3,5-epimerase [Aetokthonos hydrillicola Thurmond2011]